MAGKVCQYYQCGNTRRKVPWLKMYTFPMSKALSNIWITNSGANHLRGLPPTSLNKKHICQVHFKSTAFTHSEKDRLRPRAVPIKFTIIEKSPTRTPPTELKLKIPIKTYTAKRNTNSSPENSSKRKETQNAASGIKHEPTVKIESVDISTNAEFTEDRKCFEDSSFAQDPLDINDLKITTTDLQQMPSTSAYGMEDIVDNRPDSDFEESKPDLLEISDTHIYPNTNIEYPTIPIKECNLFGEYISKHMQKLPENAAIQLQMDIQALILKTRLDYIRENNSATPNIKEEPLHEELPCMAEPITNASVRAPVRKRQNPQLIESKVPGLSNANPPPKKQLKHNTSTTTETDCKPIIQAEIIDTDKNQLIGNEHTELDIFAEHISIQLKTFPEEVALQLQSEFYEIIRKYSNKSRQYNQVRIKTDCINDISEEIDRQN